jgi:hypothetical protein
LKKLLVVDGSEQLFPLTFTGDSTISTSTETASAPVPVVNTTIHERNQQPRGITPIV